MSNTSQKDRKEQARLQVGRTTVTTSVASALVALFLLMVVGPPLVELGADLLSDRHRHHRSVPDAFAAVADLGRGARAALRELELRRPRAANERLREAIGRVEDTLEENSLIRRRLRAPVQRLLTSLLGLGNEQSYLGREGWLYFRPDFDYSVRRGFLDADELERRRRGVDSSSSIRPDPIPALLKFAEELAGRGVRLLVLPVPGKTVIHPQPLLPRGRSVRPPLHNPSFGALLGQLEAAGVATLDPTPELLVLAAAEAPVFLRGDSHWTPRAVEVVAAAVARKVESLVEFPKKGSPFEDLIRRPLLLTGRGDLVNMLRLTEPDRFFAPERIEVRRVERADGGEWRPRRGARVLVLGDSFTNVFSDPSLGWGSAAGLAEQLAFELGRPVDRIARNAGGSHESRQELARELASGRDRLAETRVVVYEFAARELVSGDWRLVDFD